MRRFGNKYGNIRCVIDGITFDSKKEGNRYRELKLLVRSNNISDLKLQVPFLLQEGFKDKKGKAIRPINYIADFVYTEKGEEIVEDVKGRKTKEYMIKKKLFQYKYRDITFRET